MHTRLGVCGARCVRGDCRSGRNGTIIKGKIMKARVFILCGLLAMECFAAKNNFDAAIGGVEKGDRKNSKEREVLYMKFNTHQSGGQFVGVLRVMMQFAEKNGEVAFVSSASQKVDMGAEISSGHYAGYKLTGEVEWNFESDVDDLKNAKIAAYAIQYGYEEGGEFVVLKEECWKVDSYEELEMQTKSSTKRKMTGNSMWTVN